MVICYSNIHMDVSFTLQADLHVSYKLCLLSNTTCLRSLVKPQVPEMQVCVCIFQKIIRFPQVKLPSFSSKLLHNKSVWSRTSFISFSPFSLPSFPSHQDKHNISQSLSSNNQKNHVIGAKGCLKSS